MTALNKTTPQQGPLNFFQDTSKQTATQVPIQPVFSMQPIDDPIHGRVAPALCTLASTLANGVYDHVLGLGWNIGLQWGPDFPQVGISIESDFRRVPGGGDTTEMHWVHGVSLNNGGQTVRALSSSASWASGALELSVHFNAIAADPTILGTFSVTDDASGLVYLELGGANSGGDYYAAGAGSGSPPGGTGTFRGPKGTAGLANAFGVRSVGVGDLILLGTNQIDEAYYGIGRNGNTTGVIDHVFCGATQAQGGNGLFPLIDNDMPLGVAGHAWRLITVNAIVMPAVTPATTATAGTNGAVPAQVAGYLPITVGGTAYKIPLFNP